MRGTGTVEAKQLITAAFPSAWSASIHPHTLATKHGAELARSDDLTVVTESKEFERQLSSLRVQSEAKQPPIQRVGTLACFAPTLLHALTSHGQIRTPWRVLILLRITLRQWCKASNAASYRLGNCCWRVRF